jgi:heparinase II/III-like protein
MRRQLADGVAAWRRMGPVAGTRAAAALGLRTVRTPLRRRRLALRPLRVAPPRALRRALGGDHPADALRRRALPALPAVERLEARLGELPERHEVLAVADDVLAHRFDLLGSGPVDLGPEIDWRLDFKSGRRWPLDHVSRVPIVYPDGSDIKVPWELGRCQHLPVLAVAHRLTGERRYLDEIGAQIGSFIATNPVELGPQWACTMDVAIRAANWIAALALCAEQARDEPWLERAAGSLLLHGRFIRSHLEWAETRGNHYLSDVVGLLPVAALFSTSREGRDWAAWAAAELAAEIEHQVRPDGCDHEASIPYHRLVCELMVRGVEAADALAPGAIAPARRERVEAMLRFAGDYTRPDGLAPQIGDNDDGRFLPLTDYGRADPRSHAHLDPPAGEGHAAYPAGGWWVMRTPEVHVVIRCGDVGVGGLGSHAHNDQLSFELSAHGDPIVVDPGSYLYTADPRARTLFRSTGFHSTLKIGAEEQNELSEERLFALEDQTRAELVEWDPGVPVFEGRHHGYERLAVPATHTRRIELEGDALVITDVVSGAGGQELEWTIPLAPGCGVTLPDDGALVASPHAMIDVAADGLEWAAEDGWYSPGYGRRQEATCLRARRLSLPGEDTTVLRLRFRPR